MSAMKLIDEIKARGGKIKSFSSLCGGLPAPEAANNPFGCVRVDLCTADAPKVVGGGEAYGHFVDSAAPVFPRPPGLCRHLS